MRIVGGEWKGHPIEAPEGRDVTRPTTDRVREAVSSMLMSACGLTLDGASVLDAFAGSGALGLELLSRGAVDLDRGACARVRRNAATLGAASSRFSVTRGDSCRLAAAGSLAGAPFDIVVLDPPYATAVDVVSGLVEALDASGLLAAGALVLYERSASRPTICPSGFVALKQKRYGQTAVDLLGRQG